MESQASQSRAAPALGRCGVGPDLDQVLDQEAFAAWAKAVASAGTRL
jgi:hypothetical protein